MMAGVGDAWTDADAYDGYIGRWSALVAHEFLAWLAVPPGQRWLEVGCGTGQLTRAILARTAPRGVVAVEPAPAYRDAAAARTDDGRVRFLAGDATDLPTGPFDVVVSGLVLNFVPDPAAAVAVMAARAPGGVVSAYVWDYAAGMQLLRAFWDAAAALDPAAAPLDEAERFPLCQEPALGALWRRAGLADVATTAITVPTRFADLDDVWRPFLRGQGPAPGYVAPLDDGRRAALRAELARRLPPPASDGSIALSARAWAVRGTARGLARP
jgi:SAM-dependent methyltransferase